MKLPTAGDIKTIWKGWGRHIFTQTFTFPSGKTDEFFVFETLKKDRPVIVFPLTVEREVIAIRQFRFGAGEVVLELPGGVPKPYHRTPGDTLHDELMEETGYRPGRVVPLGADWLWFEPASLRVQYVPLLALGCVFEKEPEPDPNEVIEVVKIPYTEWIELIRNGEVRDDKSIALTFLASLHFGT